VATGPLVGHVVVTGLMGAGKTTIGRALSTRLGWPFSDSDAAITSPGGQTAREIAERSGPARLHRLEADHLRRALKATGRSVVAAAASVVDDPRCVTALEAPEVLVVYLRATAPTLVARFDRGAHRPLYGDDAATMFLEQIATRGPVLERIADIVVDVDLADSPERLGRAARAIAERARG
jgi:shikimate kinase